MAEQPIEDDDPEFEPATEHEKATIEHEKRAEELEASAQMLKDAWQQTLDDLDALEEKHREEGRDVVAIPAADAGPIGRDTNEEEGEYGMEFVIPDNFVEEFREAFEAGEYPQYDVYRAEMASDVFMVVELVDPDAEYAILLAGAYPIRQGTMCAYAAREEGEMFTFVRTLDGERHGAFRHEGYKKFFPRADEMPEDPAQFQHT